MMSRTVARRFLWIAALVLVPVPLLAFAGAVVPTARFVELAVVVLITIFVEGPGGVAPLLLGLFLVHALVYAALLWLAAWGLTWALERAAPAALRVVVWTLVLFGLGWTLSVPVYHTPFHARLPHATLLEVYR